MGRSAMSHLLHLTRPCRQRSRPEPSALFVTRASPGNFEPLPASATPSLDPDLPEDAMGCNRDHLGGAIASFGFELRERASFCSRLTAENERAAPQRAGTV